MDEKTQPRELTEREWRLLVDSLTKGNLVLLLGPDIPVPDGQGGDRHLVAELTTTLAEELGLENAHNLAFSHVAQKYDQEMQRDMLDQAVSDFYGGWEPPDEPSVFTDIAALPFRLIITSRHDRAMEVALRKTDRTSDVEVEDYNFRGGGEEPLESGTVEKPVLYYLTGQPEDPDTMVLTDDDLLVFLSAVVARNPSLPDNLRSEFQRRGKMFLFLGFGLRHWPLRVILHALELKKTQRSYAIEGIPHTRRRDDNAVEFYQTRFGVNIVEGPERTFIAELRRRWEETPQEDRNSAERQAVKANDVRVASTPDHNAPTVFISYSSENEDLARDLYETMRSAKLNPWWDKKHLRGGGAWHAELTDTIEECDYFVVLQTPELLERDFSYVNEEINVALAKQGRASYGVRYIFPVATEKSLVLPQLREIQTTVIETDDQRSELAKEIYRDAQRSRRR